MIDDTLGRVSAGQDLTMDEMTEAIGAIMDGKCSDAQIGLLLTALRAKGESVAEVAGAALAMRRHMTPIRTSKQDVLDTCGTGGDQSGTFNISTAAALVAAAAGVPVAKHGNRSITSKSGSADVLAALGVNIDAEVATVETCLEEAGICFCFAPRMHPSMKHVAGVRKKLGVPTIFNLLGPLCNPASAPFQLLGVGRPEVRQLLADAMAMLGTERTLVVCGEDGLDEVSLTGPTLVIEIAGERTQQFRWNPDDFGLPTRGVDTIGIEDASQSAAMVQDVLSGQPGAARDFVVANAAAALWTVGRSESLQQCARLAAEAIDSQAASATLARLVELSNA